MGRMWISVLIICVTFLIYKFWHESRLHDTWEMKKQLRDTLERLNAGAIKSAQEANDLADALQKQLATVTKRERAKAEVLQDALISFRGGAKILLKEGDQPYLLWMVDLADKALAAYESNDAGGKKI